MRIGVVVVASGAGTRLGSQVPKQFLRVAHQSILDYSLSFFERNADVSEIVLVLPAADLATEGERYRQRYSKIRALVAGGANRIDSVHRGIERLSNDVDRAAVHDGVRPFVSESLWRRLLDGAAGADCVVPGIRVVDTVKQVQGDEVVCTPDRSRLRAIQTPQLFRRDVLLSALDRRDDVAYTDEATLLERGGRTVRVVQGDAMNRKITTKEDLDWMRARCEEPPVRVGTGYDVHRLGADRPLILGGVHVPHATGLVAHSDGDVVAHALMDALLGALARGDIGAHFPDTEEVYRDASSMALLARVASMVEEEGYRVGNVDLTVLAQAPRLGGYRDAMRRELADALGIETGRVSVKATTTEGLGFCGRGEGIAVQASCLLVRASTP